MNGELKPVHCGCGGEAWTDYIIGEPSEGVGWFVCCKNCDIQTPAEYPTEADAIEAWNRAMSERTAKDTKDELAVLRDFWAEQQENPSLTWDELKSMEGKPVWVVEEGYQTWEYWSLVYWMKDDELTLLNENGLTTYSKNEQGTVWQAYRKERG